MGKQCYTCHISVSVFDPRQLRRAAIERAVKDGIERSDAEECSLDDDNEPDISYCLVMLLDPGTLPGCNIEDSGTTHDGDIEYG